MGHDLNRESGRVRPIRVGSGQNVFKASRVGPGHPDSTRLGPPREVFDLTREKP